MSLDSRSSVLAQGVEKVALFFVEPETEGAADLFIEASSIDMRYASSLSPAPRPRVGLQLIIIINKSLIKMK